MTKFYKKHREIFHAIQYDGSNASEIVEWSNRLLYNTYVAQGVSGQKELVLYGRYVVPKDDWIFYTREDGFYMCSPAEFSRYEQVRESRAAILWHSRLSRWIARTIEPSANTIVNSGKDLQKLTLELFKLGYDKVEVMNPSKETDN